MQTTQHNNQSRARWAAAGAALAITLGAGGIGVSHAAVGTGARATYTAITPCRIADTRNAPAVGAPVGIRNTPLGAQDSQTYTATGTAGNCAEIPVDTTAIVANVTGLDATEATYLSVSPGTAPSPGSSSLNVVPGQPPTPNAVTVGLDQQGRFNVYNAHGNIDYLIDIVGMYQDHHHDDRYAPRVQYDHYDGFGLHLLGTGSLGNYNGCATNHTGSAPGVLPITLPGGAIIQSVAAVLHDGPTATLYDVRFQRRSVHSTGATETVLRNAVGGTSTSNSVTVDLSPATQEVVDPADTYVVYFAPGASTANALCNVTVKYTMPTP